MANRFICVHAHFYQPPRENPWLEEVEFEQSAYPFHDWNERITSEAYLPNAFARILNENKKIVDIVNNYKRISFNFGPTLISWMKRKEPATYQAILDSDKESQALFSGHGAAIAQCYNHVIMPLASQRDKETQVIWGIAEFKDNFKREPEGMWLPETAVDTATLEVLAVQGIKFTILAPHQAAEVRPMGKGKWQDVRGGKVDPRVPYLCRLPSGRSLALFFYDGPTSRDIAFGDLLDDGNRMAARLLGLFHKGEKGVGPEAVPQENAQLISVATDGETYGHHHKFGDMGLAYCLNVIGKDPMVKLTVYGEFLERFPPRQEVKVLENTSWSCAHGIERWRSDCGCRIEANRPSNQKWRVSLREGMDQLRDAFAQIFDQHARHWLKDPWSARNAYVQVILDRSADSLDRFLAQHASSPLEGEDRVKVIRLLEMQRHSMLMFTSCGWFFDDISGIEALQVLKYAARAIQAAGHFSDEPLEEMFLDHLEKAASNHSGWQNGKEIYERFVRPSIVNLSRVVAHYAVSQLFDDPSKEKDSKIFSFTVQSRSCERETLDETTVICGQTHIQSDITLKKDDYCYAALHLGAHRVLTGVRKMGEEKLYQELKKEMLRLFKKGDMEACEYELKNFFEGECYSLHHLFKDAQSRILFRLMNQSLQGVVESLKKIADGQFAILKSIRQLNVPIPQFVEYLFSVIMSNNIMDVLSCEVPDYQRLRQLLTEVRETSSGIDQVSLGFLIRVKINAWMEAFALDPREAKWLKMIEGLLAAIQPLKLDLNLWQAQNIFFKSLDTYAQMCRKAQKPGISEWVDCYEKVGGYLSIEMKKQWPAGVSEKEGDGHLKLNSVPYLY